jgi:hypothetical protein
VTFIASITSVIFVVRVRWKEGERCGGSMERRRREGEDRHTRISSISGSSGERGNESEDFSG